MVSFLSEAWLWRVCETTFLRNLVVEKNQWRSVDILFVSFLLAPHRCPAMDSVATERELPQHMMRLSVAAFAGAKPCWQPDCPLWTNRWVRYSSCWSKKCQLPKTARRDSCARWANLQHRFTPFRREPPLLYLTSSPLTCLQTKTLWEATQARKIKKSTKKSREQKKYASYYCAVLRQSYCSWGRPGGNQDIPLRWRRLVVCLQISATEETSSVICGESPRAPRWVGPPPVHQ